MELFLVSLIAPFGWKEMKSLSYGLNMSVASSDSNIEAVLFGASSSPNSTISTRGLNLTLSVAFFDTFLLRQLAKPNQIYFLGEWVFLPVTFKLGSLRTPDFTVLVNWGFFLGNATFFRISIGVEVDIWNLLSLNLDWSGSVFMSSSSSWMLPCLCLTELNLFEYSSSILSAY